VNGVNAAPLGRFPQRFGLDGNDLALDAFLARVHPDDREAVIACHEQPAASSDNYSIEYRFSDAHGIYHWLLSRARLLDADPVSGRPLRLAGTHVDIDALKATEEALVIASQQAQAANVAKTRFLSSMSHELRTPLNAIHGFAQMIQLELAERNGAQNSFLQYTEEILSASNHLCLLVDDILDLARIEAEKTDLHLESVDARQIMSECLELIRPQAAGQALHLESHLPEGPLLVMAEPRRLRQILLNLLGNAVKFTETGEVAIEVACANEAGQRMLQVAVRDTGIGIAADQLDDIFIAFSQGDSSTTRRFGGTGLGLSITRRLVELLGGRLWVDSVPGQGSCFHFSLPAEEAVA